MMLYGLKWKFRSELCLELWSGWGLVLIHDYETSPLHLHTGEQARPVSCFVLCVKMRLDALGYYLMPLAWLNIVFRWKVTHFQYFYSGVLEHVQQHVTVLTIFFQTLKLTCVRVNWLFNGFLCHTINLRNEDYEANSRIFRNGGRYSTFSLITAVLKTFYLKNFYSTIVWSTIHIKNNQTNNFFYVLIITDLGHTSQACTIQFLTITLHTLECIAAPTSENNYFLSISLKHTDPDLALLTYFVIVMVMA